MEDDRLDGWIFITGDAETSCSATVGEVLPPFEVSAQEFLEAAQQHLAEGNDNVRLVDALTDAKRALDCRLEELLYAFGLLGQAKRQQWNVPKKLEVLGELALPAPRLLWKINSFRNAVEHEFRAPNRDLVADFVDGVTLFLESTWWYLSRFSREVDFENSGMEDLWWRITLDRDAELLRIQVFDRERGEISRGTVEVDHPSYLRLLRAYLAALFGRQWLLKTWTWE